MATDLVRHDAGNSCVKPQNNCPLGGRQLLREADLPKAPATSAAAA